MGSVQPADGAGSAWLLLLMQWLEGNLTYRTVADDIALLLGAGLSADELERAVSKKADALLLRRHNP